MSEHPHKPSDPVKVRQDQQKIADDLAERQRIDMGTSPTSIPPAGRTFQLPCPLRRKPILKGGIVTGRKAPNTI